MVLSRSTIEGDFELIECRYSDNRIIGVLKQAMVSAVAAEFEGGDHGTVQLVTCHPTCRSNAELSTWPAFLFRASH